MRSQLLATVALFAAALGGCSQPGPAGPPPTPAPTPAPAPAPSQPPGTWAGIDVGSRGVKPVVLTFARGPGGWDFDADTSFESKNTDLGTPAENGQPHPDRLAATAAAVADMVKAMRAKHDLPADRVRVVVSSGVMSRVKDKDAGRAAITAALEKATGRPPGFIDGRQEAELAARGVLGPVPKHGRMVIDVGGANTKFGWFTPAGFQGVTLEFGTKAYHDEVAKRAAEKKQPFAEAVAGHRDEVLTGPLKKLLAGTPGADQVADVQMVGGASWALSTFTHPAATKDPRVPLTAADVAAFAELARLKPDEARARAVKGVPEAAREAAAKEVERVQKVFAPEELQAAAEVVRAGFDALGLAAPGKTVAFYQKGQHAWIAGYLMGEAKLPE
ncbi:MAG: hypothetical protein C0501_11170 [Isosphaera sp.]|nr:hypothetical protein [Isosphaera sp.]